MKKTITLVLTMAVIILLCACGKANMDAPVQATVQTTPNNTNETANTTTQAPEEKGYSVVYTFEGTPTDLLTIEEIDVQPDIIQKYDNANFFRWKMKVRNTSGADLVAQKTSMRIWYNYLDMNKDVLWTSYQTGGYNATIENEKAKWIEVSGCPDGWGKKELEDVTYIEIYGYTTTLAGAPDHTFQSPILINVKERTVA